ncbi:MAG: ATP-binding protein [Mycobacterium leprae]
MSWWQQLTLRSKVVGLTTVLVLCSFATGLAFMAYSTLGAVNTELGARAMSVARTVAQVQEVQENLGKPGGAKVIEPVVERMRLSTGVEYIVTFDMNRVRYSHPLPERIGTLFEGGDEGPSLSQQAYTSMASGVNGESVRAFVPVLAPDSHEQVGVVVVGIMAPHLLDLVRDFSLPILLGVVGSLAVAVLGAQVLASNVKRQMFNLEPPEIARMLEERVAVFSALSEGLIAVAQDGRITVINEEAQRMIGVGPEVVGRSVLDVLPHSQLLDTIRTGKAQYNQQMLLGRTLAVTNRVPVLIKDRIVGAVATFRDRTEVHQLAEELTGVTRFVEGLRAQNHESRNKLHTIAGLIQLKKYQEALDYIFTTTEQQQEVNRFLASRIADYRVSGLLLGKVIRGRELGIYLQIDRRSRLDAVPEPLDGSDLVLILGNLIENAMDALNGQVGARQIDCLLVSDQNGLRISVQDNGPGISPELRQEIFRQGFSTKGEGRGLGLALVQEIVWFAGGRMELESEPGRTLFTILVGEENSGATT